MCPANDELDRLVIAYQNSPCDENEKLVFEAIRHLVDRIFDYLKVDREIIPFNDTVCHAMDRIWHFDPVKGEGKAFNYFTSVALCFIRSLRNRESKYSMLREKYRKHLHPQGDFHAREALQSA